MAKDHGVGSLYVGEYVPITIQHESNMGKQSCCSRAVSVCVSVSLYLVLWKFAKTNNDTKHEQKQMTIPPLILLFCPLYCNSLAQNYTNR